MKLSLALVLACQLVVLLGTAKASTFTAPADLLPAENQQLTGVYDANGTFAGTGHGAVYDSKLKLTTAYDVVEPTVHPVSLFAGPLSFSSNPIQRAGAGAPQWTVSGPSARTLSDLQNLDLNLLGGSLIPAPEVPFTTIVLHTDSTVALLKTVDFDLTTEIQNLTFLQTGGYSFVPTGDNTGTYSIDGDFRLANNVNSSFYLFDIVLFPIYIDLHTTVHAPLTGTYTITSGVDGQRHIALDGNLTVPYPLTLSTELVRNIGDPLPVTISGTLDLISTLSMMLNYHLETNLAVPEPGSVILLGIGLMALLLITRRGRKR